MPREQAFIQQYEVWFVHVKEFQSRQPIRSDDNVIASLLCKRLTQAEGSGTVILHEKERL